MARVTRKKTRRGPFVLLAPRAYDRLLKLCRWVEDTPEGIDLPDGTWDSIHMQMQDSLDKYLAGEESATVETWRGSLVAVVEDEQGDEVRVPIIRAVPKRK